MPVGVLALQGCIEPHMEMFRSIGAEPIAVRLPEDLEKCDRIVLPGGESTTMIKLLERAGLWEPLQKFGRTNAVWGICAGAILAAEKVFNPTQRSLDLIPISATRNFYGSQLDSFATALKIEGFDNSINVDFIRAPMLQPLSPSVRVLARCNDQSVLMQCGRVLVSAFHTELGNDPRLHRSFLTV